MPNNKSAAKRIRQNEASQLRNKARKSRVKTLEKKFLQQIADGNGEEAKATLGQVYSAYDKAVKTNVIHQNKVNRKKERLYAQLQGLEAKA